MSIALIAGVKIRLAVPAEVGPARRALHVHAAPILLDPHPTFGAGTAVRGVLSDPLHNPGAIISLEAPQLVADEARMRDRIACSTERHAALAALELLPVGPRHRATIYHLKITHTHTTVLLLFWNMFGTT